VKALALIIPLALAILVAPRASNAQQPIKVFRIGVLYAGSASPALSPSAEAFQQGLHDLGYVEGHNLVIEYRYVEGRAERLPDLAAELVRLQVDVIVAEGGRAEAGSVITHSPRRIYADAFRRSTVGRPHQYDRILAPLSQAGNGEERT